MNKSSLEYLKKLFGESATFRDGQYEAIEELVERKAKLLLVQRTGWGKSIVYFIAAKQLRDRGFGPALLVSPLLSLMRNQIAMADQKDLLKCARIDSSNKNEWDDIKGRIRNDEIDMLLISPERLANDEFNDEVLPLIKKGIGFFIVDEAHCISDWGHDFRPDYRRIKEIINYLPPNIPVLTTTATANNRVIDDINAQLGTNLKIMRGRLGRDSLSLRNIGFNNNAERLAWLVDEIKRIEGSGIIYCLTVRDTERVADWLRQNDINAKAYNADIDNSQRERLENELINNRIKALVATIALGMGFDKPDLAFVIHFQKPQSVVHYYQQVGRAGRALENAYGVLLHTENDDNINEYFIKNAFPPEEIQKAIVEIVANSVKGLTIDQIQKEVNLRYKKIEGALKILTVDGILKRDRTVYYRTLNPWKPDFERMKNVTAQRELELKRINEYINHTGCLMRFLCKELDDPQAIECGKCASCIGLEKKVEISNILLEKASHYIRKTEFQIIKPKFYWPSGIMDDTSRKKIADNLRLTEGRAMCYYNDFGLGQLVADGKYLHNEYGEKLIEAAADFIINIWGPEPFPEWVTAIPSSRTKELVPLFVQRLVKKLRLPFKMVLRKSSDNKQQKSMQNSYMQCSNVRYAFEMYDSCLPGTVLLVDDIVDSGWTLTIVGIMLRENGSGAVIPFTLSAAPTRGE